MRIIHAVDLGQEAITFVIEKERAEVNKEYSTPSSQPAIATR
jgi:hypothetical protein